MNVDWKLAECREIMKVETFHHLVSAIYIRLTLFLTITPLQLYAFGDVELPRYTVTLTSVAVDAIGEKADYLLKVSMQ